MPRFTALPWIPTDADWRHLLQIARSEPLRNRVMLALAYDAGLRREELCLLSTGDIDPAHRTATFLSTGDAERLLRVGNILMLARHVFGNGEKGLMWLRTRDHNLPDRTPLSLITTEPGGQVVEALLWQIDEAVYT